MKSFSEYLTIDQAAKLLGVTKTTLRRWDNSGKLKSNRHPINKYRLYKREDLEALLNLTEEKSK